MTKHVVPTGISTVTSKTICLLLLAGMATFSEAIAAGKPEVEDLTGIPIEALLNTEIYSASRFVQNASEAPSAVSVLTATDIKTFGWRTLAEALRSLPGLYTSYDRNYTYLGARGFLRAGDYNPRFLLLIDGNRANDPIYDQALIGSEFAVDIDLIDRIEYVPGPGSSVYGSNAFFGVINVITKRGRDFNGWQVSGEAGSQNMRKGRISHGWKDKDGAELLISATGFHTDGKDQFYPEFASDASGGIARNLDYDRGRNFFLKGSIGPYSISLAHSKRTKGNPTASYEQEFNAPGSEIMDEQTLASFGYRHSLSSATEMSVGLFFNQYKYQGDWIYSNASNSPPLWINRDKQSANWWGGDVKLVSTSVNRHKLMTGIEYQKSNPIKMDNYYVEPFLGNLHSRDGNSRVGFYIQDEWQASDKLLLSAGLRYDHNSTVDSNIVNPRLGIIYRLAPPTTLKFLFGKAYRLPNSYEMYYAYDAEGGQKINPDLKTEHIRSYELVMEHQLSSSARFRLSAYRNKVRDLIMLWHDPADELNMFRNISKATATGIESALEQVWRNGTRLRASYAWQQTKDEETGEILENSPRHLGKLNVSVPFYGNLWRAGLETLYVSSRKTLSGETGSYVINNLTLFSDRLVKNVELSASVYNLFDRRYSDPVGEEMMQDIIRQDGRTLRFKMTYSF